MVYMLGVTWEEFSTYLFVKKGLDRDNTHSYKSIYARITHFFLDKTYNESNFLKFMEYLELERKLSNSSVNNYLKVLKHLNTYLSYNPDFTKEFKYKKESEKYVEVLTAEETFRLFKACYSIDYRVGVMAEILAKCGIRNRELINLRFEDVKDETLILRDTKASVEQTVWCPDELIQKIRKLPRYPHGYVVGTKFGQLNRERVNVYLRKAAKEAGIVKPIWAHMMRYTCGTLTYEGSKDLVGTGDILRHKDINTTRRYIRLSAKNRRDTAKKSPLNAQSADFGYIKELTGGFKKDLLLYPCCLVKYKEEDGVIVLRITKA